jgi:hypothetical protein
VISNLEQEKCYPSELKWYINETNYGKSIPDTPCKYVNITKKINADNSECGKHKNANNIFV